MATAVFVGNSFTSAVNMKDALALDHARRPCWWTVSARSAALGLSLFAILTVARIVFARISYQGDLEWMEGGMLGHVQRVLSGRGLYVRPSIEFVPFIYPPLYIWTAAAMSVIVSPSLFALRLVSALAYAGILIVLCDFVRRRTGDLLAGMVAAGTLALMFRLGGAFADLARIDSEYVFFLVLAAHLLFNFSDRGSAVWGGLALAAACLTKQSGCVGAGIMGLSALVFFDKRRFLACALAGVVLGLSVLCLAWSSAGWAWFYLVQLPSDHAFVQDMIAHFWRRDIFTDLAVPALLSLFALLTRLSSEGNAQSRTDLLVVVLSLVLPSWLTRFHAGQYDNVLMPMHAAMALGAGMAVADAKSSRALSATFAMALGLAAWTLHFDVQAQIPSAGDRAEAQLVRAKLAKLPAKTWIVATQGFALPQHGPYGAQLMAMIDVLNGSKNEQVKREFREAIELALAKHELGAVLTPGNSSIAGCIHAALSRNYTALGHWDAPRMFTGGAIDDYTLWLPNTTAPNRLLSAR